MSFISFSPKKTIIGIVFYWRGDKLIKENRETLSCPTVAIPSVFVGRTSVLEINRLDDLVHSLLSSYRQPTYDRQPRSENIQHKKLLKTWIQRYLVTFSQEPGYYDE